MILYALEKSELSMCWTYTASWVGWVGLCRDFSVLSGLGWVWLGWVDSAANSTLIFVNYIRSSWSQLCIMFIISLFVLCRDARLV